MASSNPPSAPLRFHEDEDGVVIISDSDDEEAPANPNEAANVPDEGGNSNAGNSSQCVTGKKRPFEELSTEDKERMFKTARNQQEFAKLVDDLFQSVRKAKNILTHSESFPGELVRNNVVIDLKHHVKLLQELNSKINEENKHD